MYSFGSNVVHLDVQCSCGCIIHHIIVGYVMNGCVMNGCVIMDVSS